jgi:hypothetical protein
LNRVNAILSAFGLLLALSFPSWAQVTQSETVTLSGTVETIDPAKKILSIKQADGSFETVEVPPSAKGFDELKVGDKALVTFSKTVSARLKPPGEASVDTGKQGSTMWQEMRPAGTAVMGQRTMTVTVSAIDKGSSTIALVGPNGWKYSRRVVDPIFLDTIKVDDQIDITWNTDMTLSVEQPLREQR